MLQRAMCGVLAVSCGFVAATAAGQRTAAPARAAGYVLANGTVRIVGAVATEGVIRKLNELYQQRHPEVKLKFERADDNGAIDALIFEASAVAPTGSLYGGGIAYSDIVKATPFFIRIAHGSLSSGANVSPLAVIVHPSNPIETLSLGQVASMFTKPVRARVFSTWGQVGVTGAQAQMAIQPAGLPWSDHYASEDRSFADEVFYRKFGGGPPVDTYAMFPQYSDVTAFVAREPGAVGIVAMNKVGPGVRVVGLVEGSFGRIGKGSADDIAGGHYPLDRFLYVYARAQGGRPLDAFVQEYLKLALSLEGQAAIGSEGEGYIPLNTNEVAEEMGKFN